MARKTVGSPAKEETAPEVKQALSTKHSDYEELKKAIERAYQGDVTISEAEQLAARFLLAQMEVAEELSACDLDARMKKNGLKTKRAVVYMGEVSKSDKKPSDTMLEQIVTMDTGVQLAQSEFEEADAKRESLQTYFEIFRDAHIYFRGISKGKYE